MHLLFLLKMNGCCLKFWKRCLHHLPFLLMQNYCHDHFHCEANRKFRIDFRSGYWKLTLTGCLFHFCLRPLNDYC
jgi:hypothetical protein